MSENRKPAGLILSAGFSSRMKEFKPLMKIGNENSLEILINSFRTAGVEDIYVIVGYNAEFISEFLKDLDVNIIMNEDYAQGMFTSIKAGVKAAGEDGHECILMTPVDIPLIPPYIIKAIIKAHEENPGYFTVPCFEGKKGHPLCIPSDYFDEILSAGNDENLKVITSKYEDRFIKIQTHAEGIVMDMDTQEAYRNLLAFYQENRYPDEEKCWKILERMETPTHVIRHCLAVTDTAIAIAESLIRHGRKLNIPLIRAAGMLHDALRVKKNHWEEGAKMALDYGYPEVADIINDHMNYIHPLPVYSIDEKDIICLADKLRQEDRLVTLEERLEPVKIRWKDDPEVLEIIEAKIHAAGQVMQFIEEITHESIYEMLREADRIKKEAENAGPKLRRLILIRHGETMKHKDRIMLGQTDVALSIEGKEQCTHVGLEMQHFDIDSNVVYSSDLNRAVESAKIITRILGDSFSLVTVPEFREMNLGHWDGMFISDIKEQFPEEFSKRGEDIVYYRIDDQAENFEDVQIRAVKKLIEIIETTEGDIVIVSHSGVLRGIRCAIRKKPLSQLVNMKFDRGTYDIYDMPEDILDTLRAAVAGK